MPHASTHGTPYVYAINNRLTALFFGAPRDDFDLLLDEEEGRPVVYECYPNALERVYSGKPCSLYTLGEEGFLAFQTGWEPELVCPEPAAVVREERIGDILEEILRGASRGVYRPPVLGGWGVPGDAPGGAGVPDPGFWIEPGADGGGLAVSPVFFVADGGI